MLNAVIIEDERPALQNLLDLLSEISTEVNVQATISSVKEGIDYFSNNLATDIIFSDVQLPDGLSFDVFHETNTNIPIIFITGYDEFVMNAFDCNGIDYLLKPVNKEELIKAVKKYEMLEKHFKPAANPGFSNMVKQFSKWKSRIMVRKGIENIPLKLKDVALFYTENKVVYIIDKSGKKYLGDKNLSELEEELQPDRFFRANRQYIINIDYVKGFKAFDKVKLQVDLLVPDINHSIIISQETAPVFRKWMYDA
jgi:DNA-binding LytR/AlgR family response regulator